MSKPPEAAKQPDTLFSEIKGLIQSARQRAEVAVNAELTLLYWQVGERINTEVLKGERADYGKQVVIPIVLSKSPTCAPWVLRWLSERKSCVEIPRHSNGYDSSLHLVFPSS